MGRCGGLVASCGGLVETCGGLVVSVPSVFESLPLGDLKGGGRSRPECTVYE